MEAFSSQLEQSARSRKQHPSPFLFNISQAYFLFSLHGTFTEVDLRVLHFTRIRKLQTRCPLIHIKTLLADLYDMGCANIRNYKYESNSACYSVRFKNSLFEIAEYLFL